MLNSLKYQKAGYYLLILFLMFSEKVVFADTELPDYEIIIKIKNCSDTVLYLNHYAGEDISNDDTARLNPSGFFIFEGKNVLDQGLYYVSSDTKKKYFDFFITDNQKIKFEYNLTGLTENITTSDSIENKFYFEILASLQKNISNKNQVQIDSIQYLVNHSDLSVPYLHQIFVKPENQLLLCEKYIKSCISPSVFQQSLLKLKPADTEPHIRIYLDHFFDNLDFSDSRMINTPVLTQRLDEFIDTIAAVPIIPMQQEVDRLISLSSANKRVQEFVAWHLINHFKTYYFLPGNDALYVHIVNDYLENGKIAWYYPEVQERESEQVKNLEPLLNGKTGPDLEMPDTSGTYHSLYSVKAKYTLLLFWASTCSHCREEMPSILKFYNDFHQNYDLEIFAVSTDTSAVRWKSFVRRHQLPWINVYGRMGHQSYHHLYNVQITPTLFLLDENKRILAKYLTPEKIGEIIRKQESEIIKK